MRIALLPLALSLSLAASTAVADVLVLPAGEPIPEIQLPAKGATMAEVEKKYGEPRIKRPTVGGTAPQQPPITRWDYDGFAVIFERDRVVDGVIPGAPPRIYNKTQLEQVALPVVLPPAAPAADPAPPAPVTEESVAPEAASEPAPATQPEPAPESPDPTAPAPAQ